MYEHEVLQLGVTKRKKAKEILDKKAQEGWELVNIIPDIGLNNKGVIETRLIAVMKRSAGCCNKECCQKD